MVGHVGLPEGDMTDQLNEADIMSLLQEIKISRLSAMLMHLATIASLLGMTILALEEIVDGRKRFDSADDQN